MRRRKQLLAVLAIALGALAALGFYLFSGAPPRKSPGATMQVRHKYGIGTVAPEIEGVDLEGRPMRLSEFRGKVVLLVYLATW